MHFARLFFLRGLFLVFGVVLHGQTSPGSQATVLPEDPKTLLQLLPSPPKDWKLTMSVAFDQSTVTPALLAAAHREYLYAPSPPDFTAAAKAAPKTAILILWDTGYDPGKKAMFNDFKATSDTPFPDSGGWYVKDDVQIYDVSSSTTRNLWVRISDRFFLNIILSNPDSHDVEQWYKWADVPSLLKASQAAPTDPLPPHAFNIINYDELDASNNQEYEEPYLTPAEHQELMKERSTTFRPTTPAGVPKRTSP